MTLFDHLPDSASCWAFAADRPLSSSQQQGMLDALDHFFKNWTSHGRAVIGAAGFLEDRFLLVAGIVPQGDLSGCGIDKVVKVVEEAARQVEVSWLSPLNIFYRDQEGFAQGVSRTAFRDLVATGEVTGETSVFDLGIQRLGQVRGDDFEKPAGLSWHARVFRLEPTTA